MTTITNTKEFPVTPTKQFTIRHVTSADGTRIGCRQIGSGPGLVIMHGGLRASQHYERLASALADQFTIYIPDRRGRGLSGPAGKDYSYLKECEDLAAILQATGARMVFGHSGGALFALEAALKSPIDKMVLYEPAVSINHSLPLDWLSDLEEAVNRKDYAGGMVRVIQGLPLNWMSKMPGWILRPLFSLMLRGKQGAEIIELLETGAREGREVAPSGFETSTLSSDQNPNLTARRRKESRLFVGYSANSGGGASSCKNDDPARVGSQRTR
ncbi:MAG: alpha/beta hydrolase [Anaerolineales bacterium]